MSHHASPVLEIDYRNCGENRCLGANGAWMDPGPGVRAWIERHEWQVVLRYWPERIGDGAPTSLVFDRVTDARNFYRLNVVHDSACAECFEHTKVHDGPFCVRCGQAMRRLRDLERRHAAARAAVECKSALWKRLHELEAVYKDEEATDADKAAVLDQIMAEARVAEPDNQPGDAGHGI